MSDLAQELQEFRRAFFPSLDRELEATVKLKAELEKAKEQIEEEKRASQFRCGEMEKAGHASLVAAREKEKAAVVKMTEADEKMKLADVRLREAETAKQEALTLKAKFEGKMARHAAIVAES